ncbi:MAG: electron transport complex subunit RsxA [bacterium (Candidatus Ratteibacteria) CG_4_10_14_3_um_filter_41_18]|uniref:Ion-translocating oxidoreductase complex subunit A n=4 Tax=Candidatus Ratteibacteria TaxID=2979319 RepID=A0A2M7E963_9BACT|nr:MAG: electron transport complex subunit RsxA [Candidatus Omnitrophica bacterium CG1_02_41_171]PIV64238.1 MAG: electron transport complex subunit RsxA [bacterium (Candidatus Ratteibacteria) CG01_land_8_20_14_3_00_40_19]PIW33842.1 MAG: electron transport complex subunit RsxA [bacterium (Candidatus Ratteibacteria) CG15_BIG_FIL_POST_REV_8_21_14_020_41_12]PIW74273.1 MAG: electron transport complex subunit RsxA [bacterium (Candidatus Ratteibacteria) CG_4_8_14_3_um_filter_41_36]PIX76684.1 MAG: elec
MISNHLNLFLIFISALLVNNILLIRFIGLCSFFGISQSLKSSLGMGMAVTFVMVMSSAITWFVYNFLLIPFHLQYLRTVSFILVIATLVQLVERFIRKYNSGLYQALGIYLPLVTTNCAILAVTFLGIDYRLTFLQSLIYALGVSLGYFLAIILFSSLRARMVFSPIPAAFKGIPIAFLTAGLMSLAFLGFKGLFGL